MPLPELKPSVPERVAPALQLQAAVRRALDMLGEPKAVTLVLNDPQRATRTGPVLSLLAERLSGVPCRGVIATGSHRYSRRQQQAFEAELRRALPFESFAWHDCRSGELVEVAGPVPWRCHGQLLDESHALLAIGSCEPHYFAGITGAHKTVTIGCAAHEDIQANHAGALSDQARPLRLAGNPVHEGVTAMLTGLTRRRAVAAINLLQVGGRIVAADAGGPLETLDRLVPLVRASCVCVIDRPADALVLEVAGVLGRSFYQADKGIKNSEWAVRDGGCLVLQAPCPEGVGQDDFLRLLRTCPTHDSIVSAVHREGYRLGDHKAVKLRHLTDRRGVRVVAVSAGLCEADAAILGLTKAATVAQALAVAGIDPGRDRVYRVADAGNTCVTLKSQSA